MPAFQNRWAELSKVQITSRRLPVQTRPDRCMLFSPFRGRFKKSDLLQMARQPLRVLVPVSWVTFSSSKLFKLPTSILRWLNKGIIKYLVLLEATIQAISTAKYTLMFSLQHLEFIINFKRSVLATTQKIEFLSLFIESVELNLSLTPQTLEKSQSSLQRNVISTSNISFGTDKIDRTILQQHRQCFRQKYNYGNKLNCFKQQAQIQALNQLYSYQELMALNE